MCNEFIKIDKVLVQSIEASSNILSLLVNHVIFELKYKTLHFDHTIKYWSESLLEYVLPQWIALIYNVKCDQFKVKDHSYFF